MRTIATLGTLAAAAALLTTACARDDQASGQAAGKQADEAAAPTAAKVAARADELPALDAVLARHFAALGGEAKLRAASTLTYSGTVTKADGAVKVSKYYQRGHKMRVEKDDGEQKYVMVWNGDRGFKHDGAALTEIAGDKAAHMKREASIDDALLTYQDDGYAVRLVGKADVKGAPAYEIEIDKGDHGVERRYIDARSHYEVKRVVSWKGEDGVAGSVTVYFSDYRDVGGGMMVNHRADTEGDKGKSTFLIESAAYDQPLDAALFQVDTPVI